MKSDKDYDLAECHYADKEDKYEPAHDCTSTKYDEIYRQDPKEREIRELKEQKEQLIKLKEDMDIQVANTNDYEEIKANTR